MKHSFALEGSEHALFSCASKKNFEIGCCIYLEHALDPAPILEIE